MYVREPHPEERGFRQYQQHESYEHKMSYARELVDLKKLDIPLMVDDMTQQNHADLGNLPNMAYVVDKEGIVRYRNNWTLADEIDVVLAELVTADDPSRPVSATMDTTDIDGSI